MKHPALPITALVPLCICTTMRLHYAVYPGHSRLYKRILRAGWPAMARLWKYFVREWPTQPVAAHACEGVPT